MDEGWVRTVTVRIGPGAGLGSAPEGCNGRVRGGKGLGYSSWVGLRLGSVKKLRLGSGVRDRGEVGRIICAIFCNFCWQGYDSRGENFG